MSAMTELTKWKLNITELLLKLFYIQGKEILNKKYYQEKKENLQNGKVSLHRISM